MNKKIIFFVTLITTLFFITSCGGNSVEDNILNIISAFTYRIGTESVNVEKEVRDVYKKEYRSVIIVNNLSSETKLQTVKLFTSDGVIITSKDLSLRNDEDNIVLPNFDKKKLFNDINSFKVVLESSSSEYEKIFETKPMGVTVVEISEADIKKNANNE